MKAPEFLRDAAAVIEARSALRDQAAGERSMERCVDAFNAMTGHELTPADGWYFMLVLKYARARQGVYHADDYLDAVAYAALLAEAAHHAQG